MRSDGTQTDLWRDRPVSAADYRAAAEAALANPFETEEQRRQRAQYYLTLAERIETSQ